MDAVRVRVRADLRRRWGGWLALACLAAVFAGGITAVAAGASRTDTAYQRLLVSTRAPDMAVFTFDAAKGFATLPADSLKSMPHVAEVGRVVSYPVLQPSDVSIIAPTDDTIGKRFWTRKLIDGRLPDPARPEEVSISFLVAQSHNIGVGDELHVDLQSVPDESAVPVTLRVVGVDAAAAEFPPETGTGNNMVWATPAFARRHTTEMFSRGAVMRFDHGAADGRAVQEEVTKLAAGHPTDAFLFYTQAVNTERSIHLQAVALWVLAGLLSIAGVLVLGQLLARQSFLESVEYRELNALGMSSGQLWLVGVARVVFMGVIAAALSVVIAAAASPLFPFGLAGDAEPHPGFAVDAVALGIGALLTFGAVFACGAWSTWRLARSAALAPRPAKRRRQPSRIMAASRTSGAPVTTTTGIAFAVETGRGRTAVPVRTTIAAAVIGIAALTGAVVFSASLGHLLDTPSLYGVTWDANVSSSLGEGFDISSTLPTIRKDPDIAAISTGFSGVPLRINGSSVDGLALDSLEGSATPADGARPVGCRRRSTRSCSALARSSACI